MEYQRSSLNTDFVIKASEKALREDVQLLSKELGRYTNITVVPFIYDEKKKCLMDRFHNGLGDFSLSFLFSLIELFWKELIYYEINELRKLLFNYYDPCVKSRLGFVTGMGISFYQTSLNILHQNVSYKRGELFQLLLAKLYMDIGDLKRYRLEFAPDVVNKSSVCYDYFKACYYAPESEFVYNKLAILFDTTGDTFGSFFYYMKGYLLVQKSQSCEYNLIHKAKKWNTTMCDYVQGNTSLKKSVVREMGSVLLICSWLKLIDCSLEAKLFKMVFESWKEYYDELNNELRKTIGSRLDGEFTIDNYWNCHKIVILMMFTAQKLMENTYDAIELKNVIQLLILHIERLVEYALSGISLICYEVFKRIHMNDKCPNSDGLVTFKFGFLDFKRNENNNFNAVQTEDDYLLEENLFLNDESWYSNDKIFSNMYIETITLIFDWAVVSEPILRHAVKNFDKNLAEVLSGFYKKLAAMIYSTGLMATLDENVTRVFHEDHLVIGHSLFSGILLHSELEDVSFKIEGDGNMLHRLGYLFKLVSSEPLFQVDGIKNIDAIIFKENENLPKSNKRNKKSNEGDIEREIQFGSAMAESENDDSVINHSAVPPKKQIVYIFIEEVFYGPLRNVKIALEKKRPCIIPMNVLDILDSRKDKNNLARSAVQLIARKITSKYPDMHFSECVSSPEMDEDDVPFSMKSMTNMIFEALECVKRKQYSKVCIILTGQLLKKLNMEPISRYFITSLRKSHGIEFNCVENVK